MTWLLILVGIIFLFMRQKAMSMPVKIVVVQKIKKDYFEIAKRASLVFSIPVERILSIIAVESGGNPLAKGSIGEIGLMQLTKPAIQDVTDNFGYRFGNPENSDANIFLGSAYLALMKREFQNLDLATQAYNVGASRVRQNILNGRTYLSMVKGYEESFSDLIYNFA